jgi:hypothetical protein
LISEFAAWLESTSLGVSVAELWFPRIECVHVIALATVAGTIFLVDTRLLWLTSTKLSFRHIATRLLPWTWGAFVLAAITGSLLFVSHATAYVANSAFQLKMLLMLLAGLNMAYFEFVTFKNVAAWDLASPPAAARLAGLVSLALWCVIIMSGRWIGFTV